MHVRVVSVALFAALGLAGCGDDGGSDATSGTSSGSTAGTGTGTETTSSGTTPGTSGSTGDLTTSTSDSTTSATTGESSGTSGSTGGGSTGGGAFECGQDFADWNDGTACPEPAITVHRYGPNTFILRQSLCTSFEGPFMFMLFGDDYVLLEDTGDGGIPIASTVQEVIDGWLSERGQQSIELVVVNSHAHGDHVQGNNALSVLPNATMVGTSVSAVSTFFSIDDWPTQTATFDLGGRAVDIIPIPGHQSAHIAIYDPEEQLLLTGDTLYPGRLYISDFNAYRSSIDRMVDHLAQRDLCWVFGTHIEMSQTAGDDYPFGADEHPNEHPLQLDRDHLLELQAGVSGMVTPQIEVHDDFIIYPL